MDSNGCPEIQFFEVNDIPIQAYKIRKIFSKKVMGTQDHR